MTNQETMQNPARGDCVLTNALDPTRRGFAFSEGDMNMVRAMPTVKSVAAEIEVAENRIKGLKALKRIAGTLGANASGALAEVPNVADVSAELDAERERRARLLAVGRALMAERSK